MSETTSLILLIALLLVSAFFSASETALVSMTKLAIRRAMERHGDRAKRLLSWERRSDELLTTILVGNNLMNIAATSLAAVLVAGYVTDPQTAVWVNTAVMASVILILAEIVPKQIAKKRPERVSLLVIRPLIGVSILIRPIVWIFGGVAHVIGRLAGTAKSDSTMISRSDVEAVVDAARDEGTLHAADHQLLEEALDFHGTTVKEIMTPRVQMVTIPGDFTIDKAKRMFAETGFSRLPVEGTGEQEIAGVVFAKDLLQTHESDEMDMPLVVADIMREHVFIPEMVTVDRLMDVFRRTHMHMIMVVGEYGDVTGLVTMEDVLERLVGQIEDEFDPVEADVMRLSDRRYLVKGSARVDDLRRSFGIELPEGDYETIAGYVTSELERIPDIGAAVKWNDWIIQVYEADERHVETVTFTNIGLDSRGGPQERAAKGG